MQDEELDNFQNVFVERKVIKSFLLDDSAKATDNIDYFLRCGFTSEALTSNFRTTVVQVIFSLFKQFGVAPTIEIFASQMSMECDPSMFQSALVFILKILKGRYKGQERQYIYNELKKHYILRQLVKHNTEFLSDLIDFKSSIEKGRDVEPEKLVKTGIEKLTHMLISERGRIREGDVFNDDSLLIELEDKRKNPERAKGISTGIPVLTELTGGWHGGELILITGRPSQGKSILLMNFAYSAWLAGYNVMFFSLEMPFRQQQLRTFARALEIPYLFLKNPHKLTPDEYARIKNLISNRTRDNLFYLIDTPEQCSVPYIDQKITQFENVQGKKIDLIIIDPLYLMKPTGRHVDKREKDDPIGMISMDCKLLAMQRSIPILGATQINREGGKRHLAGKTPTSMDLSFSDRLGHNSDIVFMVGSDFNDLALLFILKFRDGAGPTLMLKKKFRTMMFEYDETRNDKKELAKYLEKKIEI